MTLHPAGFALIDPAPIVGAGNMGERALGRVAAVLGGAAYPLRRERLARLCQALAATPSRARTLGGCRFVPWCGRLLALRETARAAPPLSLAPGASAVWDRRFRATLPIASSGPVTVGQLGASNAAGLRRAAIESGNPLPRTWFIRTLPAAQGTRAGLVAVPHLMLSSA